MAIFRPPQEWDKNITVSLNDWIITRIDNAEPVSLRYGLNKKNLQQGNSPWNGLQGKSRRMCCCKFYCHELQPKTFQLSFRSYFICVCLLWRFLFIGFYPQKPNNELAKCVQLQLLRLAFGIKVLSRSMLVFFNTFKCQYVYVYLINCV